MTKYYTYRIKPTEDQKIQITRMIGCSRFMYNKCLSEVIKSNIQGRDLFSKEMEKCIPILKQEYEWLNDCPAQILQSAARQVSIDCRYKLPVFQCKKKDNSIRFPQGVIIIFKNDTIRIPKIGNITCLYDRRFKGKIKEVTLYKTVTGKYYTRITVDNQISDIPKRLVNKDTAIGISTGINTWYGLSNGTRISKPTRITKSERMVRIEKRSLDRKVCGSKRREKQKKRLLLAQEKLHNQQRDYLQKVSTKIILEYDTIVMEQVPDKLKEMVRYKCQWYNKNLIEIGQCKPCPEICSLCGTVTRSEDITWKCSECSTVHNRNKNNAENVKLLGLRCKPSGVNAG